MYSRLTLAATAAALFGAATADLSVVVPGGPDLWWVDNAQNNIVWTCQGSPYANFTVLVANQNPKVLSSPIAIVAVENNFDCSKTITPDQANQAPGTGYMIQLANTLNETDVYAQSQPFEIKAAGAEYPASSATPTASGTSSASASGGAASASSSPSKGAAASSAKLSAAGLGLAAVGALFGFMA
jgi:hypothetical protein